MFFSFSRMSQFNVFVFTFTESLFKNFGEPKNAFKNPLRTNLQEGEVVCGSIDGSASGDGSDTLRKFLHEDWLRYPLEKLMDRLATGHPSRGGARDVVLRALKMNISLCECNFI